jgi:AraC family transcriptional regulator
MVYPESLAGHKEVRAMSIVRSDSASGAYGRSLARNFGADEAPAIVSRLLQHAEFAVTEVVADRPNGQLTTPIPLDDAYLICLNLRAVRYKKYWEEGREIGVCIHRTGETAISDLRRSPRVIMDSPVHHLMIYLPRTTMNALAEQASLPRVENIRFEPGPSVRDDVFWELGRSLLPALRAPAQANRLFTDHVAMALALHAAYAYGGQSLTRPIRGGLASWQEKRAKEMMLDDLPGRTSMSEIATACRLSPSYFARSFRKATGLTPHAWLLRARVERAMLLLRQRDVVVSEVAAACGFVSPSHFTRVFTRQIGASPTAWRRQSVR